VNVCGREQTTRKSLSVIGEQREEKSGAVKRLLESVVSFDVSSALFSILKKSGTGSESLQLMLLLKETREHLHLSHAQQKQRQSCAFGLISKRKRTATPFLLQLPSHHLRRIVLQQSTTRRTFQKRI
jgi:hypothetical protein